MQSEPENSGQNDDNGKRRFNHHRPRMGLGVGITLFHVNQDITFDEDRFPSGFLESLHAQDSATVYLEAKSEQRQYAGTCADTT